MSRKSSYREMYFILEVIYQIFILIDQFTQFPSREKGGYPNSVKSHLIVQFLVLKLKKITETLICQKKNSLLKGIFFYQYRVIINRGFIMPQCHKSIYSLLTDTFKCDFTKQGYLCL